MFFWEFTDCHPWVLRKCDLIVRAYRFVPVVYASIWMLGFFKTKNGFRTSGKSGKIQIILECCIHSTL